MTSPFEHHTGLLSPWVDRMRANMAARYIPSSSRILDVGCGPGLLIKKLKESCIYMGIDQDKDLIEYNRRLYPQHRFYSLDICKESFPMGANEFDRVVMAALLEHVTDPTHLFQEVKRVLKPVGKVIVTTPSKMGGLTHALLASLRLLSHHAAEDHKDFLNGEKLAALLKGTGLKIEFAHGFQVGMNQLFILGRE